MPDKEGSEDEKTTKGVVKKKTKQMLNQEYIPEEEYDRYRDRILMRGGDHRSKETRERSYTPTGKQPKGDTPMQKEFKKKYGKKATALDAVRADHKDEIMDLGNKKKKKNKKKADVQDEFDLTKIAEAFGGYIVEANGKNRKKNQSGDQRKQDFVDFPGSAFDFGDEDSPEYRQFQKDRSERGFTSGDDPRYKSKESEFDTERKSTPTPKQQKKGFKPKGKTKLGDTTVGGPVKSNKPKSTQQKTQDVRDKLIKRIRDRSALRKSKSAQRQAMAGSAGEKTGSLRKGDLSFPGDRTGATDQAKFDVDFKGALRRAGGTGDVSPTASKEVRDQINKEREARAAEQGTPDPFGGEKPKRKLRSNAVTQAIDFIRASDARLGKKPSLVQQRKQEQQLLDRLRRQGMADSGAPAFKQPPFPDPTTGPASPVTFTKKQKVTDFDTGKLQTKYQVKNPSFPQFSALAKQAKKDIESLGAEREKLRSADFKDVDAIRKVNKKLRGAVAAADAYTAASKGVGKPAAPIRMTKTQTVGYDKVKQEPIYKPPVDTPIGAYIKSKLKKDDAPVTKTDKGGPLATQNKDGAITVAPKEKSLVTKSVQFAKKNPALSLLSLDAIRKFLPSRSPFGAYGGRVGSRSAPS